VKQTRQDNAQSLAGTQPEDPIPAQPLRPLLILASDYVDLPRLKGLCPSLASIPAVMYFLEDQFTYPLSQNQKREFEFCAVNFLSCVCADRFGKLFFIVSYKLWGFGRLEI
jgi:hypothetical protein